MYKIYVAWSWITMLQCVSMRPSHKQFRATKMRELFSFLSIKVLTSLTPAVTNGCSPYSFRWPFNVKLICLLSKTKHNKQRETNTCRCKTIVCYMMNIEICHRPCQGSRKTVYLQFRTIACYKILSELYKDLLKQRKNITKKELRIVHYWWKISKTPLIQVRYKKVYKEMLGSLFVLLQGEKSRNLRL